MVPPGGPVRAGVAGWRQELADSRARSKEVGKWRQGVSVSGYEGKGDGAVAGGTCAQERGLIYFQMRGTRALSLV